VNCREAAPPVDRGFADREATREFERHRAALYEFKRAGVNRPS
jgi:hypothetical protein